MISNERLNEIIRSVKMSIGMSSSKTDKEFLLDLYYALQEFKERRESDLCPATKFVNCEAE